MKKCDFILMILNCKAYKHKSNLQKETWLKELPTSLPYYHVIGHPDLPSNFIFDENEHILYVKTSDDYNSLPQKVICAYEAFYKIYDFKYIFKTDDDQNLINKHFFSILMNNLINNKEKYNYGGYRNIIEEDRLSEYYKVHECLPRNILMKKGMYCSGRFYFLSKSSISNLLQKKEKFSTEFFEDYAIGYHLDEQLKSKYLYINVGLSFNDFIITS